MKLAFIYEDEAWFWVLNEDTQVWECSYESGDLPASRVPKMDQYVVTAVTERIAMMTLGAINQEAGLEPVFTTV